MEVNIDKIQTFPALIIFKVASFLLSGFLFLFVFNRSIFISLDLFRLTLISISLTSPILILNICMLHLAVGPDRSKVDVKKFHDILTSSVFIATFCSYIVLYLTILIGYFIPMSLKIGVLTLIIVQSIFLIFYRLLKKS